MKKERFYDEYSPSIKIGLGIGLMASSVLMMRQATLKAKKIEEERLKAKIEESKDDNAELTVREKVKSTWYLYLPSAIAFVSAAISILSGQKEYVDRGVILTSALKIAENNISDYKEVVADKFGQKKEQEVRDEVVSRKLKNLDPVDIYDTGYGNTMFYDDWSGRAFYSDAEHVKRAFVDLNQAIYSDYQASLNTLYAAINIPEIGAGEEDGWQIGTPAVEPIFTSAHLYGDENLPCTVIQFSVRPKYEYWKLGSN